ncbi:MAG TPA: ATP-binding protein [Verrucomicrobiae bacterium]|jgi:PAS domain S-box-containing protein|nr:ATP-binding protein [Verrucomicrobiae bacterium]
MKTRLRLLHLEDNPLDAELILSSLERDGFECEVMVVQSRTAFEKALASGGFDLVLSDFAIPGYDGPAALAHVRRKTPDLPFILVSGTVGEERAIEVLKSGASDYVLKTRLARLPTAVRRALQDAQFLFERKRDEERIRDQAALLDKAQDAICVQSLNQIILYWNKGAHRLYGWSAEEAVGADANQLLFPGQAERAAEPLRELIRRGEWRGEFHQVRKDGGKIVVESRWTLMRDEESNPKSILVINTDLTEKKDAEAKFLRTQRMESIGALAGGIAHDLNNTLAPILMAADMLEMEIQSPNGRAMLQTVKNGAQRGTSMVKQILSFARGVSGEHTEMNLKKLILDIESFIRGTFPPGVRVEKKIAPGLFTIRGDATQLHQVLLNLCVNARDAMADGGRILIEVQNVEVDETLPRKQKNGPHVVLSVTDTGHGMPAEVLKNIFEPFFTTKEAGKGTGLGLSTVFGIIKTHGGFVTVSSEVDKGTTFRVYLPAVSTTLAPPAPQQSRAPEPKKSANLAVAATST